MTGRLVLVVGPSGAGKDSLIEGARIALADDARFVFPRRIVTRAAVSALEDHDSVSVADFAMREAQGAYALSWRAHGLCYGLPASLRNDLAQERTVVVNASRATIAAARAAFGTVTVVLIDAPAEIRARRLAARGREGAAEIAERLRREGPKVPESAIRLDNGGSLAAGIQQFVSALQALAAG